MKRVLFAIGSLALVALLGITMVGRSGVDAQDTATTTPDTSGTPAAGSSSDSTRESAKDAYLAALAANLGITTDALQAAIDQTNSDLGVNGGWFGGMGGNGPGRGGNNNPGNAGSNGNMPSKDDNDSDISGPGNGPSRGSSLLRDVDKADAAAFLGITEDELNTDLQNGQTFLTIALAQGKTEDDVRAFLIEQATNAIDERLQTAADAAASATATQEATTAPAQPANTAVPTVTPTATA